MSKHYPKIFSPSWDLSGKVELPDRACKSGGFGSVFKGTLDGNFVAVKVPRPEVLKDPKYPKRIAREMQTWSLATHKNLKNVQPLLGYCTDVIPDVDCFVSLWRENGNAREFVRDNPTTNRITLLREIAEGITYLHKEGIVHGDIRGANILIGSEKQALITDFGLSHYDAGVTGTTSLTGSVRWEAPERTDTNLFNLNAQQSQARPLDVWSFGMTILELVAGRDPYAEIEKNVEVMLQIRAGKLPHRPDAFVDDEMWGLCRAIWQKSPEKRPPMNVVTGELVKMEHSSSPAETKIPFWSEVDPIDKALQQTYDEILEGHRRLEVKGPLLEDRKTQRRLLKERRRIEECHNVLVNTPAGLLGFYPKFKEAKKLLQEAQKFNQDTKDFIKTAKRRQPPEDLSCPQEQ